MTKPKERWWKLITEATAARPQPVQALTPIRRLHGTSHPVVVDCDDGRRYVVKGRQTMRPLIADHVVGRLGTVIGAPVPEVELVHIPSDLIQPGSFLAHFEPGVAHGSLFIELCRDSPYVQYAQEQDNVGRFASLAVLYGWTDPEDRQYLYGVTPPHLVYSADHGAFFAGSSEWTVDSLCNAPPATLDQLIASQVGGGRAVLREVLNRLQAVTDSAIARAVAAPPDAWGITLDERIALAQYLASRRDDILAKAPTG